MPEPAHKDNKGQGHTRTHQGMNKMKGVIYMSPHIPVTGGVKKTEQ